MDEQLFKRWQSGAKPFDGSTLLPDDLLPLSDLRVALAAIAGTLKKNCPDVQLRVLHDWHMHDGYITSSQPTGWEKLDNMLKSDESLYEARCGDDYVYLAFYPDNLAFLLRLYVLDEAEELGRQGWWGTFDLTATLGDLQRVKKKLPDQILSKLGQTDAKIYFDRFYAG